MIAARGSDHARDVGMGAPKPVEIHDPAAHLEGADGRVVLLLDPHLAARALAEERGHVLRRGRDVAVYELLQRGEAHWSYAHAKHRAPQEQGRLSAPQTSASVKRDDGVSDNDAGY